MQDRKNNTVYEGQNKNTQLPNEIDSFVTKI